jgi:large subunit ribosomal protein L21
MYAIVKVGGRQYRVEQGDSLLVDRMPAEEGSTVELEPLLFRDDDAVLDPEGLARVKVEAVVRGHERGEKIHVLKFKPKRGYKRRMGHRSELTRLEISELSVSSGGKGSRGSGSRGGGSRGGGSRGRKEAGDGA